MRTAETMIRELDSALLFTDVKNLMIQYAKEAIIECAERVELNIKQEGVCETECYVDKQSILNLINELQ